jgi:hypothetical protein
MKEQNLQKKILNIAEKVYGAISIKIVIGNTSGIPDTIYCFPGGRFVAIEVKRPGEEPTPLQVYKVGKIKSLGGIAGFAYTVDDAIKIFEEAKQC